MTIDEQVYLYLLTKGNKRIVGGVPYRLIEFDRLSFFWKELGLNKFDLEKCHKDWQEEIWLTHLGIEKAKNETTVNAKAHASMMPQTRKNVHIEKLI